MPLQHLIYISKANSGEPSRDELCDLLSRSLRKNRRLGVTGMLLYASGGFMQLLEGEDHAVAALFEHIRQDPLHSGLTVLLHQSVAERSFEDWAMAFCCLDSRRTRGLPGEIASSCHDCFDPGRLRARPSVALELLRHYSLNNGLAVA